MDQYLLTPRCLTGGDSKVKASERSARHHTTRDPLLALMAARQQVGEGHHWLWAVGLVEGWTQLEGRWPAPVHYLFVILQLYGAASMQTSLLITIPAKYAQGASA